MDSVYEVRKEGIDPSVLASVFETFLFPLRESFLNSGPFSVLINDEVSFVL